MTTAKLPAVCLPSAETLKGVQTAIVDFVSRNMAPVHSVHDDARRTGIGAEVRKLLVELFRETEPPEVRTPEMILIRVVGPFCEHNDIAPSKQGVELYKRLNQLLRGGGEPLKPIGDGS